MKVCTFVPAELEEAAAAEGLAAALGVALGVAGVAGVDATLAAALELEADTP